MKTARFSKTLLLFLAIITVALLFSSKSAFAALSSCSASVDTSEMDINSSGDVIFEITNNDDGSNHDSGGQNDGRMRWVQITVPTSDFSINDNGNSVSSKTYAGGYEYGTTGYIDERVTINAGPNPVPPTDWIMK